MESKKIEGWSRRGLTGSLAWDLSQENQKALGVALMQQTQKGGFVSVFLPCSSLVQELLLLIVISVEVQDMIWSLRGYPHSFHTKWSQNTWVLHFTTLCYKKIKHNPRLEAITNKFKVKNLQRLFPWVIYIQDSTVLTRWNILLRSLRKNSNLHLTMYLCISMLIFF